MGMGMGLECGWAWAWAWHQPGHGQGKGQGSDYAPGPGQVAKGSRMGLAGARQGEARTPRQKFQPLILPPAAQSRVLGLRW